MYVNEEKIKKERKIFFIAVPIFLFIALIGFSFAFFNYTRTGSSNVIKVGRISFVTRQTDTINLTNLFPIDPEEQGIMDDDTKVGTLVIEIEGDTDYSDGIEYLVSSVDTNIYTNAGQPLPISLDFTVDGLGTPSANYFTAREDKNDTIYKKLVGDTLVGDQMLLVGFIKPNTTSGTAEGIDGSITIKAYLDKNKILISDTYDGTESDNMGTPHSMAEGKTIITTTEWNALQQNGVSFQVKVEANEGIWVNPSLEEIMRRSPVMDNVASEYVTSSSGINFTQKSGDTNNDGIIDNGKGIYMHAGTENDSYPIVYYRGDIKDNNVLFANKCWKAVRTTDTGGVKLVYNGGLNPVLSREYASADVYESEHLGDKWTFDATSSTWNFTVNDGMNHEISFKVPNGENYDIVITGTTGSACGLSFNVNKNGSALNGSGGGGGSAINYTYSYGTLTSSDELKISISGASSTSPYCSVNLKMNMIQGSTKLSKNDYIMLVEKDSGEYNCDNLKTKTSIVVNGENRFPFNKNNTGKSIMSYVYAGYMYGKEYESKTGKVTNAYYSHYFEYDDFDNDGVKEYKLYNDVSQTYANKRQYSCGKTDINGTCSKIRYYYSSDGNDYIELENGIDIDKAINEMQVNTNDSNAKRIIDTWYANNLLDYTGYLEDTTWCNDRSIQRFSKYSEAGYAIIDFNGAWAETLVLNCPNWNDNFTVNNTKGNMKLIYPIALLTSSEIKMSGYSDKDSPNYLGDGDDRYHFYSMSPAGWWTTVHGLYIISSNNIAPQFDGSNNMRPAISIKPGQLITKGDGTANNPYVIE